MDTDFLKAIFATIICSMLLYFGIHIIIAKFFAPPQKKLYEITFTGGRVIKDSLKEYKDRFDADTITYYKNQIVSSKEIK